MNLEAKSPVLTHFIETVKGIQILRAFGWQRQSKDMNNALLSASQQPYYQLFMIQRWLNLVLDVTTAGVAILMVGLAIRFRTHSTLIGLALVNVIFNNETLQLLILQ
ncbi:ABC transporter transmembrane region [Aspergillus sclerotialis]|uniref:ABC transporter transmembrane region n=1 Tax=Aspergillus sclerotialis TaxID=2070753 RepID=A0A3A2ZH97_9EURO|nr:ABC transporter transmembrane region [Aspergillus sclerotialis]